MKKYFSLMGVAAAMAGAVPLAAQDAEAPKVLAAWDFESGTTEGFSYNPDWNYQYDGGRNTTVEAADGRLRLTVDYSANSDSTWSQLTLTNYHDLAVRLADCVSFDWYYDPALIVGGAGLKAKVTIQDESYGEAASGDAQADLSRAVAAEGVPGMNVVRVTVPLNGAVTARTCKAVALSLVGYQTGYRGEMYIDNIAIGKTAGDVDAAVDSTVRATGAAAELSAAGNALSVSGGTVRAPARARLADPGATAYTRALYSYLAAVGQSGAVLFGHQNDESDKAGNPALSPSDTADVTGSIAGVVGMDALSLTGMEFSARKCNERFGTDFPATPEGNVAAAAYLANREIGQGAIVTLSAHAPNFSLVQKRKGFKAKKEPSYAKYDFSGYTPNVLSGDVMNQILPGGLYAGQYAAYLDMVADFASRVDGAVLFRPFHENTGSWFWWGAAFCDAEQYRNVYRYTVSYLRDTRGVHNLLYVYSPGSEPASEAEFEERYPGDAFVDMVGFDMYHRDPEEGDGWFEAFKKQIAVVQEFADAHGKLFAVTETGVATSRADAGDSQTALHRTGNKVRDWYGLVLDAAASSRASYFLVWADFAKNDGYYVPYVDSVNADGTLHGHELLDSFITFFNDGRSVFAVNQKAVIGSLEKGFSLAALPPEGPDGFITAPAARSRITGSFRLGGRMTDAAPGAKAEFVLSGKNGSVSIAAKKKAADGTVGLSAKASSSAVKKLGSAPGTISLVADGVELSRVPVLFNMEPPAPDPFGVDNFEGYYGASVLLNAAWATNKASGCGIDLSLAEHGEGTALRFEYTETANGWAGAVLTKEADWSTCNALSLWTIPDGNRQLTVIQVNAGGNCYEAYLNEYDGYASQGGPLAVTIPFAAFAARDIAGHPTGGLEADKAHIESLGLWVNAIPGTPAVTDGMVAGTLYYDDIRAVQSAATEVEFRSQP